MNTVNVFKHGMKIGWRYLNFAYSYIADVDDSNSKLINYVSEVSYIFSFYETLVRIKRD